ncbi:hypothetical protein ACIPYR_34495 [Streptomyces parvus]|uniref:hypothetical protein n=1 Tax=Streptomyces parvus TaxID=66428 RepID=UPI00382F64D0
MTPHQPHPKGRDSMPPTQPTRLPRRPDRTPRRAGGTVLTLVRAAGSLVVLAGLLAGLPLLLWWGTSAVGPDGVRALGNLLSTQDSGQVFLLTLAVAGWIGWALFALSVLLEIPAQLRGRTAPQVRLLVGQRAAATLVGAVLLALPTGTALAASATPAQASPTVAAASVMPGSSAAGGTHDESPATEAVTSTVTHTVVDTRPAESLWSIAEQRLGDGNRWEEIVDLNSGHTMADGSTFRADGPIQPGWTLRLPADASPARAATTADPTTVPVQAEDEGGLSTQEHRTRPAGGGKVYTVTSGDNLSKIAGQELGDADAYPAIFELNKGEPQPGGGTFTNPDLLYPGQKLDLPAQAQEPGADRDERGPDEAAEPDTEPPAAQPEENTPPGSDEAAPPPAPAQTPPVAEAPSATPEAEKPEPEPEKPDAAGPGGVAPTKPDTATTPSAKPTSQQPTKSPAPAPSTPAAQESAAPAPTAQAPQHGDTASDSDGGHQVALAAGIGALLAASLAGTLAVKRILQQRRRRAGETIAIDADPTPLEQVLNTQGGPTGVALLDTALRTLAHSAQAEERELPVLHGARVSDRTVELILDEPADPLTPFIQGSSAGRWVLDAKATLLDLDNAADDAPAAPYPGLVTLGATENGDLLLTDLLHSEALLLDGTADDVLAVGRAMALEAGTCGWTDHTEIMTVGLGARLATLLPRGRVRPLPHVSAVVADLGALLLEVHQQTGDTDMPEPLPWILVCAGDVDAEQAWQLADAVSAARDLPIAIVLPANDATRAAFPAAESVPTAPGTPVTLPQLGDEPVHLQRLTDEQYRQYLHALQVTEEPAKPATGTWQLAEAHEQTAAAPRPEPDPLLRIRTSDSEGDSDPGSPYPALLSSIGASRTASKENGPAAKDAPEGKAVPDGTSTTAAARSGDGGSATELDEPVVETGEERPPVPEVSVLGPLTVSGITHSGHGPKVAALAALIHLRPGRSAEFLCTAMDPVNPWSTRTLQTRLSEIRSRLGAAPDGQPYLPRPKHGGYSFHPDVTSDWRLFQDLATQGLADPEASTEHLESALALLRGKPFEGRDFSWADAVQQEMISRIVDTAHTLAVRYTEGDQPDLDAARRAALRGLEIDETAEVLYRDWMNIEWGAGNTAGVRKAIARLQQVARTYDISLEPVTEQLIDLVLSDRPFPART